MRTFDTKIDNTAPAASGRLPAAQFNSLTSELDNLLVSASITGDPAVGPDSDLNMISQAVARYASGGVFAQDTGSTNALVLNLLSPFVAPKALFKGLRIMAYPAGGNNAAATVNAFGLGIKPLYDHTGTALVGGETVANRLIEILYDPAANGGSGAWKLAPWANQLLLGSSSVVNNTYNASIPYIADSGSTNHIVGAFSPTISSLTAGLVLEVKIANTNTGATDFQVNSISAKAVHRIDGSALRAGDVLAGEMAILLYDGTAFQLLNPVARNNPMGLYSYGLPQTIYNAVWCTITGWSVASTNTFTNSTFTSGVFTVGANEGGIYAYVLALREINFSTTLEAAYSNSPTACYDVWARFNVNGTVIAEQQVAVAIGGGNSAQIGAVAGTLNLAVGDVVTVDLYCSRIGSSTGASLAGWSTNNQTYITLNKLPS